MARYLVSLSTELELPSRERTIEWATRIVAACRREWELRAFEYGPQF